MKALLPILALCLLAARASHGLVRMAVLFGNNAGLAEEKPLLYATRDAEQVHATLLQLGGLTGANALLLLDPSVARVRAALEDTRKRVAAHRARGEKVQLLLYYSGHGSEDALHMNGERLPVSALRDYFRDCEADLKVLIADACFSGALIHKKGAALAVPSPVRYVDELKVNGSAIITSSSAGELSQESRELRGSLFTHHLLTGLRGAGDADRDGKITLWEAYAHAQGGLRRHLASSREVVQTPEFDMDIHGSENVVLTRLDQGQAFLSFKGLPSGVYRVLEAGTAQQVAEVGLSDPAGMDLALPRSSYLVYRVSGSTGQAGYADLRKHRRVELGPAALQPVPVGLLSSKGMLGPAGLGRMSRGSWHISAEPRLYPDFPGRGGSGLAWEASLRGNWRDFGASLGGGRLPERTGAAGANRFAQDGWYVSGEGRYYWSYSRWGAAYLGPRAERWWVGQEVNGIDFGRGSLLGTFALAGLERHLLMGLSVHASLGAGAFWSRDAAGDLRSDAAFPLSLGLRLGQ